MKVGAGSKRIIYVSRLMKGWEMAQAVAEFKAQEQAIRTRKPVFEEMEVNHAKASSS